MTDAATTQQDAFAGLPPAPGQNPNLSQAGIREQERSFVEFEIPEELLGPDWQRSGLTDSDRTFGISAITLHQKRRAGALGGADMNIVAMTQEMLFMCIYTIGGQRTNNKRDRIETWLTAIGPQAYQLVERAYNSVNTAREDVLAAAVARGRPRMG